jgi:L-ascorbate metabolism protein UlaG (beta-lactamase superfamily)
MVINMLPEFGPSISAGIIERPPLVANHVCAGRAGGFEERWRGEARMIDARIICLSWRTITDYAKRRQWPLLVADRLGRGRGRLRVLDRIHRLPRAPQRPDFAKWERYTLAAAWIGHATTLLRIGGQTILTDPVFSAKIGLGFGLVTAGPRRMVAPAVSIRDLPKIDAILLSHAHFDHLDRPSLARLPKNMHVITAHGLRDLIDDLHFQHVTELQWGESMSLGPIQITAQPVQHWGARTFYDTHRGYCAFLLEASSNHCVLYGADTAYHTEWRTLPAVDLAVVGIGAYDPYIAAHATPEQALEMADHVRAKHVLPMHYGTFRLSHEPTHEPIQRILAASENNPGRIVIRDIGGMWHL